MKPAPFDIVRPATLGEASKLLRDAGAEARAVAGCQSLGPILNLRLAAPRLLVDLTAIPDLTQVGDEGESVRIGACVTTAYIEDGRLPGGGLEALAQIAQRIAYRAVRNRGTIGGSLCHADPAADWVSALCAFGAHCTIFSAGGRRRLPVADFVTGPFENALQPGDILEAVHVPRLSGQGRWGYYKVCRKAGEFASALGAVVQDAPRDLFRAVIGAVNGPPIIVENAGTLLDARSAIDASSVLALLDRRNVREEAARHQQIAALTRAYRQAGTR
jgi:carbon-monoxide dehydrogenase medium subunit